MDTPRSPGRLLLHVTFGLSLVLTAMGCGKAWSAEPNLPAVVPPPPVGFNGPMLRPGQPLPVATPAPLLRSLDAVAMRPVEVNSLEEPKAASALAPVPAEAKWDPLQAALWGGFKLLGAALLALAGASAVLAWYIARCASESESEDVAMMVESESAETESLESVVAPREDLRELLQPLLRASLAIEYEPADLPSVTRIFGRPLASTRYRIDLGHELGDPHFRQPVPVETVAPAWEETAWAPIRRLDQPYVAPGATAWERPVSRPEGIRT